MTVQEIEAALVALGEISKLAMTVIGQVAVLSAGLQGKADEMRKQLGPEPPPDPVP